jgi:hypothetical protein
MIGGASRGSRSHSDSFHIGSASVCLVDFALRDIFFFGPIGGYLAFSLWYSKLLGIFLLAATRSGQNHPFSGNTIHSENRELKSFSSHITF